MKKNTTKIFIAAIFLTISGTAFAQEGRVGINTSTPAATLDVVASPSNATRIDGFIAPRLKGSELKAKDALYTTAQDGAIVYVTEAVSGVTDKTTNVTSIGYYYFDKTQGTAGRWMKIANPTTITYQEPWVVQGGTTPATTNSQAISQNASVAIGKSTAYNSTNQTMLDVAGAVRVGINQSGAVGTNSLAIGDGNTASGSASFASGQNTTASGNQSTAVGNAGKATGNGSFAGGYWNVNNGSSTAAGQSSFAFGEGANAKSDHSLAFGKNSVVNTTSGVVLGSYNELTNATNALFQLGNGTSSGTSNAITVLTDGKTGIGTSAPTQKLDVNGASRLRGQIYDNNNAAGANGQVLSTNSSGQVVWQNNIAITPMAIGVMNNAAPSNAVNSADYNTGSYIDLPAGKWVVNTTMLLTKTGSFLANDASLWIRAAFSTSPSSFIQAGNILSGSLVGPSQFGLMNGIVVINNTSGSIQRYYLWRALSQANGTATGNEVLANFAGGWGENQIVATPVN